MEYTNSKTVRELLSILKIDISFNRIKETIESHPYSLKLVSLMDAFDEWGIDNIALELPKSDFERIKELPFPFIAHISDSEEDSNLVVVKSLVNQQIEYYNPLLGNIVEQWADFKNKWSGILLLAFNKNNGTINQKEIQSEDLKTKIQKLILNSALIFSILGVCWIILSLLNI